MDLQPLTSRGFLARITAVWFCASLLSVVYGDPPQTSQSEPGAAATAEAAAETESRIQEWIAGLSSGEYATRRRAFLELWKQGKVALPAVRRALTTSDQQTVSAARVLENLLNLGLSPADHVELSELLQLTESNWAATMQSLGQKGYWTMAADLLRSKPELLSSIREEYPPSAFSELVQIAFDQGDAFQAWPLIAQGLAPERRFYLTELTRTRLSELYQAGIPESIQQHLQTFSDENELSIDERAMHYLFTGRAQAAWDLNPSPRYKQRIVFHTGRWEWLQDPAVVALTLGTPGDTTAGRARAAAYSRMSGDEAKHAEHVAWLRNEIESEGGRKVKDLKDGSLMDLLRMLILCGEGELVNTLTERGGRILETDHLTTHFQHAKVLEKYELDAKLENFDEWLAELPGKLNPNGPSAARANRPIDYMELVRFLAHTGWSEQAERLYRTLFDSTRLLSGRDGWDKWNTLVSRSEDHQIRKFLLKYLEDHDSKLRPEERRMSLVRLFPEWINCSDKLFQHAPAELVSAQGNSSAWYLLERLWRYDRMLVDDEKGKQLVEKWLNEAMRASAKGEDSPDSAKKELATVALKLGLRKQALAMARTEASSQALSDTAEMLTANNSFEAASKWWETAISQSPGNHAWIRRYVEVLLMQGERELADKYEASIWIRPLDGRQEADDLPYGLVAEKYFDAGDYDLAQQYSVTAVELGDAQEQAHWARRLTTIAIEREDYATAARASRIYLLSVLTSGASQFRMLPDSLQYYEYFTGQELLTNAAKEIQAGQIENALRDIGRFESILPAGIEICEHCYPLLVKAGHQAAADQLLERCTSRMLKHLESWTNDASSHNNLAWMLARCNARIPEALEHARKAVELSDRSPTYVDTLAEAEFRAGNLDRAIELARECTQADPRHAHYQKQLQRFLGLQRGHATP